MSIPYAVLVSKYAVTDFLRHFGWKIEDSTHYSVKKDKTIPMKKFRDPVTGNLFLPHEAMEEQMERCKGDS